MLYPINTHTTILYPLKPKQDQTSATAISHSDAARAAHILYQNAWVQVPPALLIQLLCNPEEVMAQVCGSLTCTRET